MTEPVAVHLPPSAVSRLGVVFGVLCGLVALAVQGFESAVLWSLVGYFLGQSIRSTVRTFRGGHAT